MRQKSGIRLCRVKSFLSILFSEIQLPSERETRDLQLKQTREALGLQETSIRSEGIEELNDVEQLRQKDVLSRRHCVAENPIETSSEKPLSDDHNFVVTNVS